MKQRGEEHTVMQPKYFTMYCTGLIQKFPLVRSCLAFYGLCLTKTCS